jgi:four helix bundle protein
MTPEELKERLLGFSLRIAKMTDALPRTLAAQNAASQVIRSSSSAASNYRASQRGKSRKDFAHKIKITLEEADESEFWLEYIERLEAVPSKKLAALRAEANELTRILAAIRRKSGD